MALIGERWGVFPRLKQWVSEGHPVWGTCAGMILLSDHALMMKKGGQALVGGLNVEVCLTRLRQGGRLVCASAIAGGHMIHTSGSLIDFVSVCFLTIPPRAGARLASHLMCCL